MEEMSSADWWREKSVTHTEGPHTHPYTHKHAGEPRTGDCWGCYFAPCLSPSRFSPTAPAVFGFLCSYCGVLAKWTEVVLCTSMLFGGG